MQFKLKFLFLDTNEVWAAAERAEDDDIYLYTIGLDIGDRTEIDETSSHPLSTYEFLTRREEDLYEISGQLRFALNDGNVNKSYIQIFVLEQLPYFTDYCSMRRIG